MSARVHGLRPAVVLLAASVSTQAGAAFPERAVRLVVISAPGGTTDIMGRLLAHHLGEGLGQPVVVDNRPGGGGLVSAEIVAQAPPDGHTLLYTHTSFSVMPSMHRKLPYDTLASFERVGLFALFPNVLLVNNALPVKSVQDLIALARARPGTLGYAAGTTGASGHLGGELFKSMAKVDIVHVPYKGTGGQLASVASGETQMTFASIAAAMPFVTTQRVRALAVGSARRSPALPSVPTVAESGLPGFDISAWNGVMAPRRTPFAVITRLNAEMTRVASLPDVRERAAAQGAEVVSGTPQAFTEHLQREIAKWARLVKDAGLVLTN
jgi:tripartite-type tricarboxylate transporter receptor subunit TctC